jgi:hypothetical protein
MQMDTHSTEWGVSKIWKEILWRCLFGHARRSYKREIYGWNSGDTKDIEASLSHIAIFLCWVQVSKPILQAKWLGERIDKTLKTI